jgi:CpXC protein
MSAGTGLSLTRFRGPLGSTRREQVHFACVCGVMHSVEVVVAVDSRSDPMLARRLRDGDASFNTTTCPQTRSRARVEVPVVYHDPVNLLFVLVLPDSARTRELAERASLLTKLADDTSHAVPRYVVDFAVAYGSDGLRRRIESAAEQALLARRAELRPAEQAPTQPDRPAIAAEPAPVAAPEPPPAAHEPPLSSAHEPPPAQDDPLAASEPRAPFVAVQGTPLSAAQPEPLASEPPPMASALQPSSPFAPEPPAAEFPAPVEPASETTLEAATTPRRALEPAPVASAPAIEARPISMDHVTRGLGPEGEVQLVVRAEGSELEMLVRFDLDVRLLLHRMPTFPIVTLAIGSPLALTGAGADQPRWIPLDISDESDIALLQALARRFDLDLEVFDRAGGAAVARTRLAPPLGDNAACMLPAAADYLQGIPPDRRSFGRALAAFCSAEHDRLGGGTSHAAEFDESALDELHTPGDVMRACALIRRFSQPTGEDWLLMTRSYPLQRWHQKRCAVVARAVDLGIWPGPVGAQIAVGEGFARSRVDLVTTLQRNFVSALIRPGSGLDDTAVRDNWRAIKSEARALGVPVGDWSLPRRDPIMSEAQPVTSGTIGDMTGPVPSDLFPALSRPPIIVPTSENVGIDELRPGARGWPGTGGRAGTLRAGTRSGELAQLDQSELVARLDDRDRRLAAALELCRRGEPSAIEPVFRALEAMTRPEASRVLASAVGFGRAVESHLLTVLRHQRPFLRQGAALALAVMKSEAGAEAMCDLLLDEPSRMWRELARALGETGAVAVMPLAARLSGRPEKTRERAAWAMAHVAARGARRPIETLAAGRDPVAAAVARRALELVGRAAVNDRRLRSTRSSPRDHTLNRAFSRRFYDALRVEKRVAEAEAAQAAGDGGSAEAARAGDPPHRGADAAVGSGDARSDARADVEKAFRLGRGDRAPG